VQSARAFYEQLSSACLILPGVHGGEAGIDSAPALLYREPPDAGIRSLPPTPCLRLAGCESAPAHKVNEATNMIAKILEKAKPYEDWQTA
jgi:hypothetical protein